MGSSEAPWTAGSHLVNGSRGARREEVEDSTAEEVTEDEDKHEGKDEPGAAAAKVDDPAAEVKEEERPGARSATALVTQLATRGAQETGSEETKEETRSGRGRHRGSQGRLATARWESASQRCLLHS